MPLHVELVSPDRVLFSGEADMVVCRTVGGGDVAFLAGHAPFVAALDTWQLKIVLAGGGEQRVAAQGGFVEVKNDRVTILSDEAELASEIDPTAARRELEEAERATGLTDDEREARVRRARVRLEVAEAR